MKSLLNRLDKQTFIFDLKSPLPNNINLSGIHYQQIDNTTIEVELNRNESLNHIFSTLSQHNVEVSSMKNKANRLEELFLSLVKKSEATL
jgi:ABC-2 type transport system ATP-binding protein